MNNAAQHTDILIVGAGMSGLTTADQLHESGREVLVVDKGRGVGGRMANRRIGNATFDHGAQFMTARDDRFAARVDEWIDRGVVEEWFRGSDSSTDGHPRWRGKPAMTGLAKDLARDIDVLLDRRIVSIRQEDAGWTARLVDGESISARSVVLTPPVPQSLALLDEGGVDMSSDDREHLERLEYDRCIAVMAVLSGESRFPEPGRIEPEKGPIAWMADNQMKGVSELPAVTIHARHEFSREHWNDDRQEAGRELLDAAGPLLGAEVSAFQVHGWRYSKPRRIHDEKCFLLRESPTLVLAGDAFGGGRLEGAALSGWAAASLVDG